MTYLQVVNGKKAIDKICKMQFPVGTAYRIFKMKKQVDGLFEFEVDREMQAVDKYHGTIQNDGSVAFNNEEDSEAFASEVGALLKTEIDEVVEPVEINVQEIGDITIAPELMMQLDGFVNFL